MKSATLLLAIAASPLFADVTVALDGSAPFKSVQQAIDAAPSDATARYVIHIKPGVYKEHIVVPHTKRFITLIGEDAERTILTFDLYANVPGDNGKPIGTFRTPSTMIQADDFSAENITFANSAGDKGHTNGQAVALAIFGDRAVFRRCRFLGWQDTLLVQTGRQLFEDCYIEGAVDYIFGAATVWFENCRIHSTGNGYITAASTPQDQAHGYVFSHCKITGEPGVKTYLGRPWRDFANVVFMNSEMSDAVRPEGWSNWARTERDKTARYAEYRNTGEGATRETRVAWAKQLSDAEAAQLTIANVLGGADGWDPKTGATRTAMKLERGSRADVRLAAKLASCTPPAHVAAVKFRDDALDRQRPGEFFDEASGERILWWTSTIAGNYVQSYEEPVEDNPRLWYTSTRDSKTYTTPRMLFDPAYPSRYAAMIRIKDRYALIHEDNRGAIHGLRVAFSQSPTGPWGPSSDVLPRCAAGPICVQRAGDSIAITAQNCALLTRDFVTFTDVTAR